MPTIAIAFPARRYHATPWDAHVNEGRIEWPPCPWRILRALLAVGYNKLGWQDHPPDDAASLIGKLSASAPSYHLPPAMESHTRHYMPSREGKTEKSAKVFDAFLRFTDCSAKLLVRFDVTLTEQEAKTLDQLARGMAYLGRAESWVDAQLMPEAELEVADDRWCQVAESDVANRVRLLSAYSPAEYQKWHERNTTQAADNAAEAEGEKLAAKGKKLSAAKLKQVREQAMQPYPGDLLTALQQETSSWQKQGWPQPPGSRWLHYSLPGNVFDRRPLSPIPVSRSIEAVEAILLSIDGEGIRGTLRPLMYRALPLMELLHAAAVRHATNAAQTATLSSAHLSELTGKDADNAVLRNRQHSHAHWLPLSLSDGKHIDHVLAYTPSPGRFSAGAQEAIARIRWAFSKNISSLSINMAGKGSVEDLRRQLEQIASIRPDSLQIIGKSRVWESTTPLVLRKYLHRRGKKTVEGQIREELAERGVDGLESVEVWSSQQMVARRLKGFVLRRKPQKAQPPCERSWGATLTFKNPIAGPLCLGYASHFGLGMFRAAE